MHLVGWNRKKDPKLVEIGKQIMNKCGSLPLAVKSIASLLRLEEKEESWREILENELWESTEVSNEIFPSLQISYARLPKHLKSCFLYCSIFPKDYRYDVKYMVKLWIYQGFIVSKGNKAVEKIGFEYVEALCQRSLFERESTYVENMVFKLHDIVHDLARLNPENRCYSIHVGKVPIFPNILYHLYIADSVNLLDPIPSEKLTALRTLIVHFSVKTFLSFDLSLTPKLRTLVIGFDFLSLQSVPQQARMSVSKKFCDFFSAVGNLKHLRYLSLIGNPYPLPEFICSLYSLQNLTLWVYNSKYLPTKIGNLISLEELIIHGYNTLKVDVLPESLCQLKALRNLCISHCKLQVLPSGIGSLTNLQTLELCYISGLSYLPPSLSKFLGIQSLWVKVKCETIGWLKDFPNLGGTLCLHDLQNISNLMDVRCANLVHMRNLKDLILNWDLGHIYGDKESSVFELHIERGKKRILEEQHCFSVLASLEPHPNLRRLVIVRYGGNTFPEWIGSLCKLEYLYIRSCYSLQFLKAQSLPLALKELEIVECNKLVSISGMQKLKSLVKVSIRYCEMLCSLLGPSLELSMSKSEGSQLTNLVDEWHPVEYLEVCPSSYYYRRYVRVHPCKVVVYHCGRLSQWCLRHGIEHHEPDRFGPLSISNAIRYCGRLFSFQGPSVELSMSTWEGSHGSSLKLTNLADEWHLVEPCKVVDIGCGSLAQWCMQHRIKIKDQSSKILDLWES